MSYQTLSSLKFITTDPIGEQQSLVLACEILDYPRVDVIHLDQADKSATPDIERWLTFIRSEYADTLTYRCSDEKLQTILKKEFASSSDTLLLMQIKPQSWLRKLLAGGHEFQDFMSISKPVFLVSNNYLK